IPSPRGHYIGWYPLRPGERWRRPDWRDRDGDHGHARFNVGNGTWRRPGDSPFPRPHVGNGVTILPVDGFTRADRARVRPIVPDRDLSGWIGRDARPGLPDLKLAPVATAPTPRGERRNRIGRPTDELIHRSVVTRNSPTDSQLIPMPPRERRVIAPPKTPTMSEDSVLRNDSAQKEDKRSVRRTPRDTTAGSENVSTPGSDSSSASRKKPDRSANPDMRI